MNKLNQICAELHTVAEEHPMNACATTADALHDSERFLSAFRSAVFPGMFGPSSVEKSVRETAYFLQKLCADILSCDPEQADCIADSFLSRLPRLSRLLRLDLQPGSFHMPPLPQAQAPPPRKKKVLPVPKTQ